MKKTRTEIQAERIEKACKENQAKQELIEQELQELHAVLYDVTDNRQWSACCMHLYNTSNMRLEDDEFIIQWNDFCGIDRLVDLLIFAIENS